MTDPFTAERLAWRAYRDYQIERTIVLDANGKQLDQIVVGPDTQSVFLWNRWQRARSDLLAFKSSRRRAA